MKTFQEILELIERSVLTGWPVYARGIFSLVLEEERSSLAKFSINYRVWG